jgi:predicted DCC family thiol-disulfide oxidoreductase YuxK
MASEPAFPLTIFYHGSCIVCATEMEHYRKKNHDGRLIFVDISDPHFEPDQYGRTRQEFMARMHVMDAKGAVYTGVDAFPVIWQAFPGLFYRLMGKIVRLPGIHLLARLGYALFARFRLYLPRKEAACESESCRLGHRH